MSEYYRGENETENLNESNVELDPETKSKLDSLNKYSSFPIIAISAFIAPGIKAVLAIAHGRQPFIPYLLGMYIGSFIAGLLGKKVVNTSSQEVVIKYPAMIVPIMTVAGGFFFGSFIASFLSLNH